MMYDVGSRSSKSTQFRAPHMLQSLYNVIYMHQRPEAEDIIFREKLGQKV